MYVEIYAAFTTESQEIPREEVAAEGSWMQIHPRQRLQQLRGFTRFWAKLQLELPAELQLTLLWHALSAWL